MATKMIYAVRDTKTGKLVSDITSHGRKYWDGKATAENAVREFNNRVVKPKHGALEIVCFELVEVEAWQLNG